MLAPAAEQNFFLRAARGLGAAVPVLGNAILGYVHTSSLFAWLYDAYTVGGEKNDNSYGNLIPFLVIGLFWWKRHELLALPLKLWWPGLLILAAALALHVAGFALQQPNLSIAALFAGIYGLMGLAWGRAWLRHSLFPYFLFLFSFPLGQKLEFITFHLRQLVSWLSEKTAHVLGIDVIRVGTQLLDLPAATDLTLRRRAAACAASPPFSCSPRFMALLFFDRHGNGCCSWRSRCRSPCWATSCGCVHHHRGGNRRPTLGNYVHEGGPLGSSASFPTCRQ